MLLLFRPRIHNVQLGSLATERQLGSQNKLVLVRNSSPKIGNDPGCERFTPLFRLAFDLQAVEHAA
ncbi:hypothetical protein MESS2_1640030 [Mesorhizobium metallidurans STM 2683]|uniref:Uncharacterized protein n=1 Tax=Mesorhizobium metallidurans STM 2683 TaxID=1297569 RepID=M5EMZ1_9HYPH|nr:hypothetical protein MESS2_1640030 [Mesorhizobium metallidurans STM 2683]